MIERIALVAGRELTATIVTRSFVMMVLAPLISLLVIPLFALPLGYVGELIAQSAGEADKPVVELADPDRLLGDRLEAELEAWEVVRVAPDAEPTRLLEREAALRVVVDPATVPDGSYRVMLRGPEDDAKLDELQAVLWVTERRLAEVRLVTAGLPEATVRDAVAVTPELEFIDRPRRDFATIWNDIRGYAMPAATMMLMLAALSLAGQSLLTSTLEEKSTRVAEVLLGAVSPVELLTGKVLGQLAASLVFALLWAGPAWVTIAFFGAVMVGPLQALALLLLIGAAALSWAAVMGGVGSAMNDVTEAQHILAPLYMVMMLGFLPAFAAVFDPDSAVIVATSLLPPTAAPVMAVRVVSTSPPPWAQVAIGVASAWITALLMLWIAGRVFRIGLLLRGSPPNIRTLLRWIWSDAAT